MTDAWPFKTFTVTNAQFSRILGALECIEDIDMEQGLYAEGDLSHALQLDLLRQAGHVADTSLDMPADDAPRSYVERAEEAGYDPSDPKAIGMDMRGEI